MITTPIAFTLADIMEVDDKYFPLTQHDTVRLLEHLPDGEEIYLTIRDNLYTEYVRAENQCGTVIVHRGVDSTPRRFPRGSCVFFEASLPLIKWLICNHDCCEDTECPCTPVEIQRTVLPAAILNNPWEGRILLTGSHPIQTRVTGLPTWMTAKQEGDRIILSGTPTTTTVADIAVAATNCSGTELDTTQFQVAVLTTT